MRRITEGRGTWVRMPRALSTAPALLFHFVNLPSSSGSTSTLPSHISSLAPKHVQRQLITRYAENDICSPTWHDGLPPAISLNKPGSVVDVIHVKHVVDENREERDVPGSCPPQPAVELLRKRRGVDLTRAPALQRVLTKLRPENSG